MEDRPNDWVEYWDQDEFWSRSELWKINAWLFFRRVRQFLEFKRTDIVCDIGCGPGYLETLVAPLVKMVHACDTSPHFVEACKKNCRLLPNVEVSILDQNYTDLGFFGKRFSLFLCVSVVQYYRQMSEVEELIQSARKIALPGARMLIADLPLKRGAFGFAWDAWCSFLLSVREGYPFLFVRSASAWLRKVCEDHPFHGKIRNLYFSNEEIQRLIRRMNLDGTIIRTNLSVYANRPSLLIRF